MNRNRVCYNKEQDFSALLRLHEVRGMSEADFFICGFSLEADGIALFAGDVSVDPFFPLLPPLMFPSWTGGKLLSLRYLKR